jgi:ferredoxin
MNTISVITKTGSKIIPNIGSVLESLERSGVSVENHCRGGYCGACRVKKTKGEVEYFDEPIGYMEDDEVLVCCSKPRTDIVIDVR